MEEDRPALKIDLKQLSDAELVRLLDDVSAELKARNDLLPRSAGGAFVDVLRALQGLATESAKK